MGVMASQITSLTIIYSTVYSGADQRKHQSSASRAFVLGIHRSLMSSSHKGLVTRKNVSIWWRHHVLPLNCYAIARVREEIEQRDIRIKILQVYMPLLP